MFISSILRTKGTAVHMTAPEATADDVIQTLVKYNIGSLVVMESRNGESRMIGIVTERDILRAQAAHRAPLEQLRVHQIMTEHVITTSLGNTIQDAMRLMTTHRIRHLPVTDVW